MIDRMTEAAVEAAAEALHARYREKRQFTWRTCSERWRAEMRDFVRPSVEAALKAADAYAVALAKTPLHPTVAIGADPQR